MRMILMSMIIALTTDNERSIEFTTPLDAGKCGCDFQVNGRLLGHGDHGVKMTTLVRPNTPNWLRRTMKLFSQ